MRIGLAFAVFAVVGCARDARAPSPPADIEIAIAHSGFCARIGGRVHCGIGDAVQPLASTPAIGGFEDATSLALGRDFGCLTTKRGTVHCWGSNASAELGANLVAERSDVPVQVVGVTDAKRVYAGVRHACATTNAGALYCWGLNRSGETGGSTSWSPEVRELATPNVVPDLHDVASASLGEWSTCARTTNGEVHCFGDSVLPEQESAHGRRSERPFRFASLEGSDDVSVDFRGFCVVRRGGVFCDGRSPAIAKGVSKVRVDGSDACALERTGGVVCWTSEAPPRAMRGIAGARDLVAGRGRWCAIMGAEDVACWGLHDVPRRVRLR